MKDTIIISIKPKYIEKILSGEKKYEFRKSFPDGVEAMLIYATNPIKRIVGIAFVEKVMRGRKKEIWDETRVYGGIKEKEYVDYFGDCDEVCAIKINSVWKISEPIELGFRPPQSYMFQTKDKQVNIENNTIMECWHSETFDAEKLGGWKFLSPELGVKI